MSADGASRIDGRVEAVADGTVIGWAWDAAQPGQPVTVAVWVDGARAAEVVAGNFRGDLQAEGIGDGAHGFAAQLPEELAAPGDRTLRATVDGTALTPAGAFATTSTRSDSPWYGANFRIAHADAPVPAPVPDGRAAAPPADDEPEATVLGARGIRFDGAVLHDRASRASDRAERVLDELRAAHESAVGCGARLLPVLLPAKEDVYADAVPEALRRARPADLVLSSIHDDDILDALDLLPALQHAGHRHAVYPPSGRRLTGWGEFVAYRAMAKRLYGMLHGTTPPISSRDVDVRSHAGDERITVAPPTSGVAQAIVPEHLLRLGPGVTAGFERADADDMARILVVGSAAMTGIATWLAESVRSLLLVSDGPWMGELLALERPDALVWVIDEASALPA